MAKYTNTSMGLRGVLMNDGSTNWLEAGATVDLDSDEIANLGQGVIKGTKPKGAAQDDASADLIAALSAQLDAANAQIAALKDGKAEPAVPPSLSGKNKAELLEIAAAEGVPDVTADMTNSDITSAIELHREG